LKHAAEGRGHTDFQPPWQEKMYYDCSSRPISRSGKRTILGGLIILPLLFATPALAQVLGYGRSSAPIYGGNGRAAQPANPGPAMRGTYEESHKTPDGRPCIAVAPTARAQIVNRKILDQIVLVSNICGQPIRVQVCYIKSSDCIVISLQGYQKLERVLGISSVSSEFRYEYRELF
jgi:hypothetical protein